MNARMVDGRAVFFEVSDFRAHALSHHDVLSFNIKRYCSYREVTDAERRLIDHVFSQGVHGTYKDPRMLDFMGRFADNSDHLAQIPLLPEREAQAETRPDPQALRGMLTRRKSIAAGVRPRVLT